MSKYEYFKDEAFKFEMESMCEEQNVKYIDPLDIKDIRIENAKSLGDLKHFLNLESISLSCADLENVEMLQELPKLKRLMTEMCDICDMSSIWNLVNLTSLSICFSDITGKTTFENLSGLKELSFFGISLPDLSLLSSLRKIERLMLQKCELTDIAFASSMKKLQYINLSLNHISDISPLDSLHSLETVALWSNEIKDIAPLKKLKRIQRLALAENPIDWNICSLKELECIRKVTSLDVFGLSVDSSILCEAKQLKSLSIGGSCCTNISFLSELKDIEEIQLLRSRVKDISCLLNLPKLKTVWLEHNEYITDYLPVHLLRKSGKDVHTAGWTLNEDYVELKVHTHYSHLGSIISPGSLMDFFPDGGVKAVAITDFNSGAAFPAIAECFRYSGISIIYGLETCTEKGHITVLVRNRSGLKNMYRIISQLGENAKNAVIPQEKLLAMRSGLLLGSGCEQGQLVKAINAGLEWNLLKQLVRLFDYLEIMPTFPEDTVITIIKLGKELNVPVCAVSDARFLNPEDELLLRILNESDIEPQRFLRDESSKRFEFSYLEDEIRQEVILKNPKLIFEMIGDVELYPDSAIYDNETIEKVHMDTIIERVDQLYPERYRPIGISQRLTIEQDIITEHGNAALFHAVKIAADTAKNAGCPIVTRGAVGASFVAFLLGFTEVNPLPPHQHCMNCGYFRWLPETVSGFDCPDTSCPECGLPLIADGHDIPMEMLFGFDGSKVPDISINTSDEIRTNIIKALEQVFCKIKVLSASVHRSLPAALSMQKVQNFCKKHDISVSDIDSDQIIKTLSDIKCGPIEPFHGVYIIPQNAEIEDFTPIIDLDGNVRAYYSQPYLSNQLLCLKIPSWNLSEVFTGLHRSTGIRYTDVPITNEAISLFSSANNLGIYSDAAISGAAGLPEFSSERAQSIMRQLQPNAFSDYVKICGMCHGSKVWEENQEEFFLSGKIGLCDLITTRDDVYFLLTGRGGMTP
jgi:hypothetical protein